MAIELAVYETKVTVRESISGGAAVPATVTHQLHNTEVRMTPASTPPASAHAAGTLSLLGDSETLDLTDLPNAPLADRDLTGLKVQTVKLKASADNVATVTVTPGASNGYNLLGPGFQFDLEPGQEVVFLGNDLTPDVAAGARTLDFTTSGEFTGTGGQEQVDYEIIAG